MLHLYSLHTYTAKVQYSHNERYTPMMILRNCYIESKLCKNRIILRKTIRMNPVDFDFDNVYFYNRHMPDRCSCMRSLPPVYMLFARLNPLHILLGLKCNRDLKRVMYS